MIYLPSTIAFARDYWKRRNTRAPASFVGGRCRKFCLVEITARSRNGGKNSRKNARAKIGPICWTNCVCHPERKRGTSHLLCLSHKPSLVDANTTREIPSPSSLGMTEESIAQFP